MQNSSSAEPKKKNYYWWCCLWIGETQRGHGVGEMNETRMEIWPWIDSELSERGHESEVLPCCESQTVFVDWGGELILCRRKRKAKLEIYSSRPDFFYIFVFQPPNHHSLSVYNCRKYLFPILALYILYYYLTKKSTK